MSAYSDRSVMEQGGNPAMQYIWNKGDGMDSVQFQAVMQYLEAIRREQKKTSDMIVGVGTILIGIGVAIVFT